MNSPAQSGNSLINDLRRLAAPFSDWGYSPLDTPITMSFYENWIASNMHGDMHYLVEHRQKKRQPDLVLPLAKSAFVFTQLYHPFPSDYVEDLPRLQTAMYARGKDYHHWFKQNLVTVAEELTRLYPQFRFLALTDSSPVLERDLAHRAGIGWFGKNTVLINQKKGSLFLIGEIYSDIEIETTHRLSMAPPPDLCGTCTRCIEACPTQALVAPRILDARKCISYWTIESRQNPPLELRQAIGSWFFGCDICQTVCPWNKKVLEADPVITFTRDENLNALRLILTSSGKSLEKKFKGTPMARAGQFGLKRNAIIVAANGHFFELKNEIAALKKVEKLSELCDWALSELAKNELLKTELSQ